MAKKNKWDELLDTMKSGSSRFRFTPAGRTKARLVHPEDDLNSVNFFREVTNSYGNTRYLVMAWLPDEEGEDEPMVHPLIITKTTLQGIVGLLAEDYDFFDPEGGFGLTIKREGSGRNDTSYTVLPSKNAVSLPDDLNYPDEDIDELQKLFNKGAQDMAAGRNGGEDEDEEIEDEIVRKPRKKAKGGKGKAKGGKAKGGNW